MIVSSSSDGVDDCKCGMKAHNVIVIVQVRVEPVAENIYTKIGRSLT